MDTNPTPPLRVRASGRRTVAIAAALMLSLATLTVPSHSQEEVTTQIARGLVPPVGWGASVVTEVPGWLPTGVRVGPDERVYFTAISPDLSGGRVYAFEDLGGVAVEPVVVADGLQQPLGLEFGPDGTLYVTQNADNRGRVTALTDADGDGTFELDGEVLTNLPNGRHQTNGLRMGPDGWIYVAAGNATDNGLDCGPEPVTPLACPAPEILPWSGSILKADPTWRDVDLLEDVDLDPAAYSDPDRIGYEEVLVAKGFRNLFDVDFRPGADHEVWTVMNGADNPASSEPIYKSRIDDVRVEGRDPVTGDPVERPVIDDMGFPSCLYDPHYNDYPMPELGHDHPGIFIPQDNPYVQPSTGKAVVDPDVFGRCVKTRVTIPVEFTGEGHEGTSGMEFARGSELPERYQGDLFYAEWGSLWNVNGGQITGHKIIHADVTPDGRIGLQREFATTPLPMDLTFDAEGVMYVADMTGYVMRFEHLEDVPGEFTIRMTQGQYVPQVLGVPRRATVTWVNEDMGPHTVTGESSVVVEPPLLRSGGELDSGSVAPGATYTHTFEDLDGLWTYHSTTDATEAGTMRGALVVGPVNR